MQVPEHESTSRTAERPGACTQRYRERLARRRADATPFPSGPRAPEAAYGGRTSLPSGPGSSRVRARPLARIVPAGIVAGARLPAGRAVPEAVRRAVVAAPSGPGLARAGPDAGTAGTLPRRGPPVTPPDHPEEGA